MILQKMTLFVGQRSGLLLMFTALLFFFYVFFANSGYLGNNDMVYAKYAANLFDSHVSVCDYCDHFKLRWIPVVVTSFFYQLLGINDVSTVLFSSIVCLTTAIFIYNLIKKEPLFLQCIVYIFFFCNHAALTYAQSLSADAGICCFNFIAYYFYHQITFAKCNSVYKNAFLSAAFLMLAVFTKETVIILLPFWLILFLSDVFKKRNQRFWLSMILFFLVFATLYLLYFKIRNNDWLYRFHLLQFNSNKGGETYSQYGWKEIWNRVSYKLWNAFLLNGDMEYLLFAIGTFFYYKRIFTNAAIRHIVFSGFVLLLCSNFMSFTFAEYSPLWPDPRHFFFVLPFCVIAASYMLYAFLKEPLEYPLLILLFITASIIVSFADINGTKYIYYALTLFLIIRWISAAVKRNIPVSMGVILILAIMCGNYFYDFLVVRNQFYYDQKKLVQKFLYPVLNKKIIIYTGDVYTAAVSEYFLNFQNSSVQFVNLDTCTFFHATVTPAYYLLINKGYNPVFAQRSQDYIYNNHSSDLVLKDEIGDCYIYEVKSSTALPYLKPFASKTF